MWRKIREVWRRKEKKNEHEGEEAGGGNWMIERKNDVYLLWEWAGFWEVYYNIDWIGLSACVFRTSDDRRPVEKWVGVFAGMCFGKDKLVWFLHEATAECRCKAEEAGVNARGGGQVKKVPDEWQARLAIPAILQVSSSKHNANKNTTLV